MKSAPIPNNENERLSTLSELEILDTIEEQAYDDLTELAANICGTPIGLVSLIDEERQWFKSHYGLDARETPREFAFCAHAILESKPFIINDSKKDYRFHDNPLVTDGPKVEFYAGVPLKLSNKVNIGTLCVIDSIPRELTDEQITQLKKIARQVETQLELRLKIKELKQLDELKSEFVAMVSHELRTPLTAIYGSLSLLRSDVVKDDPEKQKLLLDTSFENAERLNKLINDILDLSKIESGGLQLELTNINVSTLLKTAVDSLENYFSKCKVIIEYSVDSDDLNILADELKITQIISNLLSNAAKFSPEDSTIILDATKKEESVIFSIRDSGPGIPKDKYNQIFEKFSQLKNANQNNLPGTGLGLQICKKLVSLHKGEIWFESIEDQGSTFYFSVPIKGLKHD